MWCLSTFGNENRHSPASCLQNQNETGNGWNLDRHLFVSVHLRHSRGRVYGKSSPVAADVGHLESTEFDAELSRTTTSAIWTIVENSVDEASFVAIRYSV